MIHRIFSDLASFKTLTFRPGLNILLAEKSQGASNRQSRNGAGKTSFTELVHFLFGSLADKESIFRSNALRAWTFSAHVGIGPFSITVSRSGKEPSRLLVEGDTSQWPLTPAFDSKSGDQSFSRDQWCEALGAIMFKLPVSDRPRFSASFRSLFSYFARRQNSGGFATPEKVASQQQLSDQQVSISHMLGLDTNIPREFQEVRQQERTIKELRKAMKGEDAGLFFGTAADLRTRLTISEEHARRLSVELAAFNVLPEYEQFEREASELTEKIAALNNDNTADRRLILQLAQEETSEEDPGLARLQRVYDDAHIVLPDSVVKRFEEAQTFHKMIVENRRKHLAAEKETASKRIKNRDSQREDLDQRRRQVMGILSEGGALKHYSNLQEEVSRAQASAETLRQQLKIAEQLESTKAELDIERARLLKALQDDLSERESFIKEAIILFESLSNSLYERAGRLTISATSNGPTVDIRIDSMLSKGIANMQIFCFDLMLAELAARRGVGPGFLIHDSHIFDGSDERQIAKAIQLGAERAAQAGFQYIVTMNSDALPNDGFSSDFDVQSFVMPVRLSDASEDGGLFGFRFNPDAK